jgi:hypothetical protein
MGSEISITNQTDFSLNITVKQVSPLYYQNNVMPGETITRTVGKVHFTIEARILNGTNGYSDMDNVKKIGKIVGVTVAMPIVLGGFILLRTKLPTGNLFGMIGNAATDIAISSAPTVARSAFNAVTNENTAGSTNVERTNGTGQEFRIPAEWCTDACVKSKGWYMNTDKHFFICGGPTKNNRLRPFEVVCLTETDR